MAPSLPMNIPVNRQLIDPSVINEVDGQQYYSRQRDKFVVYSANWQGIDNTDRRLWEPMFLTRGNTKPLVAAFDPTNSDRAGKDVIYGRVVNNFIEELQMMEYNRNFNIQLAEIW